MPNIWFVSFYKSANFFGNRLSILNILGMFVQVKNSFLGAVLVMQEYAAVTFIGLYTIPPK